MKKLPLSTLLGLVLLGAPAAAQQAAPQAIDPKWMTVDARAKRVSFDVIAGHTPLNGALNFNGYRDGELTFVVPAGWTVVMNFLNSDGALAHSAEIIEDKEPLPLRAVDPAIPNASTKDPEMGLSKGGKETIRFTAAPAGSYVVFCAVPGHGLGGMWVRLKIDPGASAPGMVVTPKPAPAGR